jgi:hypothetical protein
MIKICMIFLKFVDVSVSDEDVAMCESNITNDEVKCALRSMSRGKSPGPDGLTVGIYNLFLSF